MSNPRCEQPGCGREKKEIHWPNDEWVCPATPEEHRLCAKVAELEAKLAEANYAVCELRAIVNQEMRDEELSNRTLDACKAALVRSSK